MNSENSKTSKPHILKLNLTDKLDLWIDKNSIALSNISIYYTCNNIKSSYNNNKFKISDIRYSRFIQIYFKKAW